MTTQCLGALSGFGLLLLASGCATTHTRAEIPLGRWSGQGTFVVYGQEEGGEGEPPSEVLHQGSYPTRLAIERPSQGPAEAIRLEILSERGECEHLEGDRTHLVVQLRREKSIADDAVTLYRLTDFGISSDGEADSSSVNPKERTYATCLAVDGDLVLRIHYMEGFVDTFRFHNDLVYKDGVYAPEAAEGVIHWSERLRPQR